MEGEGPAFLKNLRTVLEPALPEVTGVIDELATIAEVLTGIGQTPKIAPALVRNFEYYTGPVFHLFVGGTKVAGGGRYDALIRRWAATPCPLPASRSRWSRSRRSCLDANRRLSPPSPSAPPDATAPTWAPSSRSPAPCARRASASSSSAPMMTRANEVTASSDGFSLTSEDGKARRLTRVEEVVQAVADAGHD